LLKSMTNLLKTSLVWVNPFLKFGKIGNIFREIKRNGHKYR